MIKGLIERARVIAIASRGAYHTHTRLKWNWSGEVNRCPICKDNITNPHLAFEVDNAGH